MSRRRLLSPGGDIMTILSIAMGLNQKYFFDKNPAWQPKNLKRRTIMAIQKRFWILVAVYLINLGLIWLLIIVVIKKLL